ncbi:MAG: hypothetical protein KDH92_10100 [Chloroflexi bacterium]|nr:hypothetical protein [Chloroflexota bacterium]
MPGAYGVQLFADEAESPAVATAMLGAGTRFARLPVQWRWIEPSLASPPAYDWHVIDPAIRELNETGILPVAVLYTRPEWASTDGCGPIDRVPIAAYQRYIGDLVERFDGDRIADAPGSPVIRYWEIENEPDFDPLNSGGEPNHGSCFGGARAAAYAEHLRATWLAIKAADPSAVVIFGGVAYERFYNKLDYSPSGPFDYHFVGTVLTAMTQVHGAEPGYPYFDWMAVHVYNDYRNSWDGTPPYNQELSAKLAEFRDSQLHQAGVYDLRERPLAITEVGLASAPADQWTLRNETLQAHYPGQVMARAKAANVRAVMWFIGKDRFTGSCSNIYDWQTFGLIKSMAVYEAARACPANPLTGYVVGADNQAKLAHAAFRTAQTQIGALDFESALGLGLTGSADIEAYRLRDPVSGAYTVVAFTDNGERLGRRGVPLLSRFMTFDASVLPGWTGRIAVTDYRGVTTYRSGSSIVLTIEQSPVYVRPD